MQNSGRVSAGAVQKNHTGSSTEPHQRAALTFKTNAHICGNQYNAFSFLMAFALYLQFKQKHVSFARDNFTHSFSRIICLTPTAFCCSWIHTGILESIYPIIHRARGSVSVQANPTTRLRSQIHTRGN